MRNVTQAEKKEIEAYMAQGEDKLYSLIPRYLPESSEKLFSPRGLIDEGKAFLQKKLTYFRKVVCEELDWPAKRNDPYWNDEVEIVAIIADAIAGQMGFVPPFLIAALLVKLGLDQLCSSS